MKKNFRLAGLVLTAAAALALQACGGDGDSTTASTTTAVPVTVVDGAVRNAVVCLDKNANGVCDMGEPSGRTDASGNVTLQVDPADAGKYPILAIVGTDAVDADHGPVGVAYTMTAPADKSAVVSPLTTLVQTLISTTGASSSVAEAAVKAQTGLNVSLFQDFTKSTSADSQLAGTVARMVVVVTQKQNAAVASAAGTTALDGTTITKADLDEAVQRRLLEILPALITALADPSLQGASAADKETKLAAAATAIVNDPSTGLTASAMTTVVAVNNQGTSTPAPTADAPAIGATLAQFNFTDTSSWYARSFASTLAQNTPDANGATRYIERRARSVAGTPTAVVTRWNTGSDPTRQADLHYNGTAWVNCGLNKEGVTPKREAGVANDYDYCDKFETGRQTRATFDISGKSLGSIYSQVISAGYTNITINNGTSLLGTTTVFPTGSKIFYQSNTPLTNAIAYYPGTGNQVAQYPANVAIGKTVSDSTAVCATGTFATTPITTLETLTTGFPGTPCAFTGNSNTGTRNEVWGYTSLGNGVIGSDTTGGSGSYYTTNTALRFAFSGNTVKYLTCQQRRSDGSNRNCDVAGTGTFTIAALGTDARVMTLNNPPAIFAGQNYDRVYVERGGKIYNGYRNKPVTSNQARFNLAATNALFAQVGIGAFPDISTNSGITLTVSDYVGEWRVSPGGAGYTSITIGLEGKWKCTSDGSNDNEPCTLTLNPATGAVSLQFFGNTDAADNGVFTATFDFLAGTIANGSYAPGDGSAAIAITGARR